MSINETSAALAALLQPLTGGRARFTGIVSGPAGGDLLPRNTYAVPVVDRVERHDLLLKTAADVVADEDGAEVEFISNLGGPKHEAIRVDCPLRLLEPPDGFGEIGVISELITPATRGPQAGFQIRDKTPTELPCVAIYEGRGDQIDLDFFRANVQDFPAVIIGWGGSELADANTQAALHYGAARVGGIHILDAERFAIHVFAKKLHGQAIRRGELNRMVDQVTNIISDRRAVDGQVFSSPGGLIINERVPVFVHGSKDFQNVSCVTLRVAVTQTFGRAEWRTFNPWVRTAIEATHPEANEPTDPNPLTRASVEFLMLSETVPDYVFEEDGQNPIFEEDGLEEVTDE